MKNPFDNHYLCLLIALLVTLCVAPAFGEQSHTGKFLQLICLTAVFLAAVSANRERKHAYLTGIVMTVVAIPAIWLTLMTAHSPVSFTRNLVVIAYCLVMAVLIVVGIFGRTNLTSHAVFGIISSYLLVGLAWALLFQAIVVLEPLAVKHVAASTSDTYLKANAPLSEFIYFSFVTMTSLGYGDLVPMTRAARTAAWLQAVVGQFYLATLVARLVSTMPMRNRPA